MKTKFNGSHHWPNLIAHVLLGFVIASMAIGLFYWPLLEMKSRDEWISPLWLGPILGIGVAFFIVRPLIWEPIGYLREIYLGQGTLLARHFLGKEIQINYGDIISCKNIMTMPRYGSGNPAKVIRCKRFPYRFVLNMKGYEKRKSEILRLAINHRVQKYKRRRN